MKYLLVLTLVIAQAAFAHPPLKPGQKLITVLATNDIHGGLEPSVDRFGTEGKVVGGMPLYSGIVKSVEKGLLKTLGKNAGVIIVDSGDQFQGTLISNHNEGVLMIRAMNDVGVSAAVAGNHDYDFGPKGWTDDRVNATNPDKDTRGAFKHDIALAKFPFISANTYKVSSLKSVDGKPIGPLKDGDGQRGCVPQSGISIDWKRAVRPSFLKAYSIRTVAGVRVAMIGIDQVDTAAQTTKPNVADLCWRDEIASYNEIRDSLEGKADLFLMLIHNGAPQTVPIVQQIVSQGANRLHAVLAGHTHKIENLPEIAGVPLIQDGAFGQQFGRVDLIWDSRTHTVATATAYAGIRIMPNACDPAAATFCTASSGSVAYEGIPVVADQRIAQKIVAEKKVIAPIASQHVGHAADKIVSTYVKESALADLLTDSLRAAGGVDVTFWNTTGIRANLPAGDIDYGTFFQVFPFNNHLFVLQPMPQDVLVSQLQLNASRCGALMQSGLKVVFQADCSAATNPHDDNAKLLHVETVDGQVVLDTASGVVPDPSKTVRVGTLDFIADQYFAHTPIASDKGNARDLVVGELKKLSGDLPNAVDGRWTDTTPIP